MKKFLSLLLVFFTTHIYAQSPIDQVFLVDRTVKEGTVKNIDEYQITLEEKGKPDIIETIRLSIIWKIIYSNGYEEIFNSPLPEDLISSSPEPEKSKSLGLGGLKIKSSPNERIKKTREPKENETSILDKLSEIQDWRPLLSLDLGAYFPLIFGPDAWSSSSNGLGLRYGMGGEFGISLNPIKYVGIGINQGFSSFSSSLFTGENTQGSTSGWEQITLTNRPTNIKLLLYPTRNIVLSAGYQFTSLDASNSNPTVSNQSMTGYTFGLGKIFPVGRNKNYLSFTANFNTLSSEDFTYSLDTTMFPDVDPIQVEINSLVTIDLKLKFHFGIIN